MKEEISKIIMKIHEISDMMYQQKQSEAFQLFSMLLNELTVATEQLFKLKSEGILQSFDENEYLRILTEAMNALETRDDVLLADILNYDLTEQFEKIKTQL
jgi:hypothetical protein